MPEVTVPTILHDGVGRTAEGRDWIARLPDLVGRAARRWDLRLGEPFADGSASWTAPAERRDGTAAVLKVSFPHDEARHEADALRAWHGHGVPLLLADDPDDWALLLERVTPGAPLSASTSPAQDRLLVGAHVLRDLLDAPGAALVAVPSMTDVCSRWATVLEERADRAGQRVGRLVDPGLVREAADLLVRLPGEVPGAVVHGDLNPGNVLHGSGERWVAIDPKPRRGDPAYDLWPLVEQVDDPFARPDPVATLRTRVPLVADAVGLDPQRVAGWGVARGVESALWWWSVSGDGAALRDGLARSASWARLLG
ncbi:hydroxyurea phosphotransferase [Cellulomonas chitinilytica]|uniref:Hydroxyurea phosphotransferase n=1 Tax=Cellulomonas chitinilytica TaxID=398759 RepID=A0A919P0E9_9CELL|nr:aminoglycoside phosphotransferase family protein [Cellulomonas chitinilytica]GIG21018.1 hydroxyurea phosphotransferase [Cellulomonas chitinilytica]